MVLVVVGVNKEVIHVDDKPSFCYHISEGVRHESLECGRRVGHSEEHDCWFIESSMGDEGGFPLISFPDLDVVVPPSYIKLGKDFGVFEFVNQVQDQREGVCILDCVTIKIAVILTWP